MSRLTGRGRLGIWLVCLLVVGGIVQSAEAALLTDPDDPRTWQGASVETFRVAFGFATRQDVIDAHILDDGTFVDPAGLTFGNYIGPVVGASGFTPDPTSYSYIIPSALGYAGAGSGRSTAAPPTTGHHMSIAVPMTIRCMRMWKSWFRIITS